MDNLLSYMAVGALVGAVLPHIIHALRKNLGLDKKAAVSLVSLSLGLAAAVGSVVWSLLSHDIRGEVIAFVMTALQVSDMAYKYIFQEEMQKDLNANQL